MRVCIVVYLLKINKKILFTKKALVPEEAQGLKNKMIMKNKIRQFLEFNNHPMYFTLIDKQWWIAVKPICEALNVNYNRQFQNLKADSLLKAVFAKQQIQIPNDQGRKMICLPEKFIYGWLFSIRSSSKELEQYKLKCYTVLFDYFNGSITRRSQILWEKSDIQLELETLELGYITDKNYQRINEIKKELRKYNRTLKKLDEEMMSNQMEMNFD